MRCLKLIGIDLHFSKLLFYALSFHFLRGFKWQEELRSIFGRSLCSVQLPRSNGEGVGYAILGFASSEDCAQALRRNGQRMPERKAVLRLAPCQVASGRRPMLSYQVCVGNLHPRIQDAQLYEAFRPLSEEVVGARAPRKRLSSALDCPFSAC